MKKYALPLFLFLLAMSACSGIQDPPLEPPNNHLPSQPTQPEPLTKRSYVIATYNVHNFFNKVCDSGKCASTDYEKVYSEQKYVTTILDTVRGLQTLQADVVMLQEIETEDCLQDLLLNAPEYTAYAFGELGTTASVDVAVIAKGVFTKTVKHRPLYTYQMADGSIKKLAREFLEVHITLKDSKDQIILLTTHLVSKATDPTGVRRIEEAKIVRQILDEVAAQNPGAVIIFGGDLNDYATSDPIQTLVSDGTWQLASHDVPFELTQTWRTSDLDHLIHNAVASEHYQPKSTTRVCGDAGAGLGASDHCALRATYVFP